VSREALLDRFRAVLVGRVRQIRADLAAVASAAGADREAMLRAVMGELHTLKGEAKMLGLAPLSHLSHALEDRLRGAVGASLVPACAASLEALDIAARALREGVEVATADAELARALERVATPGGERDAEASVGSGVATPAAKRVALRPNAGRWTQVDASQIEALCERLADLSTAFRRVHARTASVLARHEGSHSRETASELRPVVEEMERCRSFLEDLTSLTWTLRLLPVEPMLERLAEHARGIAKGAGKSLRVTVRTGGAELERDVLDPLWDSLLHLVQNAIDHGIEPPGERGDKSAEGVLAIAAEAHGPHVLITVEDDGRGIDVDAVREAAVARGLEVAEATPDRDVLRLVFVHGLSTRATVSDVSGRGVGLDVVRRKIESLGGEIDVRSTPSLGSRFTLRVPSVITKERTVVVDAGGQYFGLPSRAVVAALRVADSKIVEAAGGKGIVLGDETVPLRSLAAVLGIAINDEEAVALVLEIAGRRWALGVPRVVGEEDLVRRPIAPLLVGSGLLGGSAVLEDGRVVLFLHPSLALVSRQAHDESEAQGGAARQEGRTAKRRGKRRVLVADDSRVICDLVREILAGEGLEVTTAHDGVEAIALFDASPPDLVLSDVEMPKMDGLGLLGEIRRRSSTLPVIMLTTRGSVEDRRRAAAAGADAYLVKSDFQSGLLTETVRRFLEGV
jgi:chemotaxis protein histidine kinase CheA